MRVKGAGGVILLLVGTMLASNVLESGATGSITTPLACGMDKSAFIAHLETTTFFGTFATVTSGFPALAQCLVNVTLSRQTGSICPQNITYNATCIKDQVSGTINVTMATAGSSSTVPEFTISDDAICEIISFEVVDVDLGEIYAGTFSANPCHVSNGAPVVDPISQNSTMIAGTIISDSVMVSGMRLPASFHPDAFQMDLVAAGGLGVTCNAIVTPRNISSTSTSTLSVVEYEIDMTQGANGCALRLTSVSRANLTTYLSSNNIIRNFISSTPTVDSLVKNTTVLVGSGPHAMRITGSNLPRTGESSEVLLALNPLDTSSICAAPAVVLSIEGDSFGGSFLIIKFTMDTSANNGCQISLESVSRLGVNATLTGSRVVADWVAILPNPPATPPAVPLQTPQNPPSTIAEVPSGAPQDPPATLVGVPSETPQNPPSVASPFAWIPVEISMESQSGAHLFAWGANSQSQIGDTTSSDRFLPTHLAVDFIAGLSRNFSAVSSGKYHTIGFTNNNELLAWGSNSYGQLGDGSRSVKSSAVAVDQNGALFAKGVVQVCAGDFHSMLLDSAGSIFAWGLNENGQLGISSLMNRETATPVDTSGTLHGVSISRIACGSNSSYALDFQGRVYAWGQNEAGQLGDGSTTMRPAPVLINTFGLKVIKIAAGDSHVVALAESGELLTWGANTHGQLGDSTTISSLTPVQVDKSRFTSEIIVDIAAGSNHNLLLTQNNQIFAWGLNSQKQLGDDSNVSSRSMPVQVDLSNLPAGQEIKQISAGGEFSVLLTVDGAVFMWGSNSHGQSGAGDLVLTHPIPTGVAVQGLFGSMQVQSISAGFEHVVAIAHQIRPFSQAAEYVRELEATIFGLENQSPIIISGTLFHQIKLQLATSLAITDLESIIFTDIDGNRLKKRAETTKFLVRFVGETATAAFDASFSTTTQAATLESISDAILAATGLTIQFARPGGRAGAVPVPVADSSPVNSGIVDPNGNAAPVGLDPGAIAGIIVACLIVCILVAIALHALLVGVQQTGRRRRRGSKSKTVTIGVASQGSALLAASGRGSSSEVINRQLRHATSAGGNLARAAEKMIEETPKDKRIEEEDSSSFSGSSEEEGFGRTRSKYRIIRVQDEVPSTNPQQKQQAESTESSSSGETKSDIESDTGASSSSSHGSKSKKKLGKPAAKETRDSESGESDSESSSISIHEQHVRKHSQRQLNLQRLPPSSPPPARESSSSSSSSSTESEAADASHDISSISDSVYQKSKQNNKKKQSKSSSSSSGSSSADSSPASLATNNNYCSIETPNSM